jgi:ribose transport system permease protein
MTGIRAKPAATGKEPPSVALPGLKYLSGPMLGLLAVLGLFMLLLARKGELGTFLGPGNIQVILHQSAITGVVALGMLLIIVSGGIDLSVGSVVALVTVVAMQVYRGVQAQTASVPLASTAAVAAGVAAGALAGLVNGLVIIGLRVSPFVATLGMLSVARGLAFWLAERTVVPFPGRTPEWVVALARARPDRGLLDPGVWSLFVLAAVAAVVLRFTVFGRYCYAIGANEATARLCGVAVGRHKVAVYIAAGLLTGWAGVLAFAQTSSGDPNAQIGLELEVIAAVVIGGASLSGGQGTVLGTLLGVLILGVLTNGVSTLNVPLDAKFILIGVIVVVNTALSQWQRRRRE